MPEHAEREAAGRVFDRLDRPVLRPGSFGEPLAEAAVALMVVALDRRALAEQPLEAAAGLERDLVVAEDAGRVLVLLVADDLGEMLDDVAAAGDVQHLASPADRK